MDIYVPPAPARGAGPIIGEGRAAEKGAQEWRRRLWGGLCAGAPPGRFSTSSLTMLPTDSDHDVNSQGEV